ncbi:30S ribosomal protein S9 [Candidatus Pacearchaeota archaeon]|nr:30S ribosomal protein S9 [Candidatus Pacearchaeota archaeon]
MTEIIRKLTVSGKRKSAIAKASIIEGKGEVFINNRPIENLDFFKKLTIQEPVKIATRILGHFNFEIKVNAKGGGMESQIEASRLAIAKAIVEFTKSKELKQAYSKYDKNLLVADTRRKEAYKPGDSKARRKRQSSFR